MIIDLISFLLRLVVIIEALIITTIFLSFNKKFSNWISLRVLYKWYYRFRLEHGFIIIISLLILLAFNYKHPVFEINASIDSIRLILITYSSILPTTIGIISAIILVGFQSLRSLVSNFAFRLVFKKKTVTLLTFIFCSSIILPLITILIIDNGIDNRIKNLTLLSSILFLISLFLICYIAYFFLRSNHTRFALNRMFKLLDAATTHPIQINYYDDDDFFGSAEADPLNSINEAAITSLKNNDRLTSAEIIFFLRNNVKKVINSPDEYSAGYYFKIYEPVFLNIVRYAVEHKNEEIINDLFETFEDLFKHFTDIGLTNSNTTLEICFKDLCKRIVAQGDFQFLLKLFQVNYNIFKYQLRKNCPSENDLWLIKFTGGAPTEEIKFTEENTLEDIKWRNIVERYFFLTHDIIDSLIDRNEFRELSKITHDLTSISTTGIDANLGPYQTFDLVRKASWLQQIIFSEADKKGQTSKIYFGPVEYLNLKNLIDSGFELSIKNKLFNCAYIFKHSLEHNFYKSTFVNELVATGRSLMDSIDIEMSKKAIFFISDVLNQLREIMERKIEENKINPETYLELSELHNSLIKFFKDRNEGVKRHPVLKKLKSNHSKFKKRLKSPSNEEVGLTWLE